MISDEKRRTPNGCGQVNKSLGCHSPPDFSNYSDDSNLFQNMKEEVTITLTAEETLMVVIGLGTYQNRIGQHSSWAERKHIPTLQRLAQEAETETGINAVQQKIEREQRYIARCIDDGKKCNALKERIKREAGITEERRLDYAQ